MGPPATSSVQTPDRKAIRKMLLVFALLGIIGIVFFAISVVIGVVVLLAAEVLFFTAYRRYARLSRQQG